MLSVSCTFSLAILIQMSMIEFARRSSLKQNSLPYMNIIIRQYLLDDNRIASKKTYVGVCIKHLPLKSNGNDSLL